MEKSPDAYRTISEVAEQLKLPQHVLRFWETRFPQVKPMKRGGNRRFYRPEDVELLRAIRILLYEDGYTIKGVQRILREQGPRALTGLVIVKGKRAEAPRSPLPEAPNAPPAAIVNEPIEFDAHLHELAEEFPMVAKAEPPHRPIASLGSSVGLPSERVQSREPSRRPPSPGSMSEGLEAVLAELLECERILAVARR